MDELVQAMMQAQPGGGQAQPPGAQPSSGEQAPPVGLCANPDGAPFQCGTCQFFQNGHCVNQEPRLNGRPVQPTWCCNLYQHPGMQTIVQ